MLLRRAATDRQTARSHADAARRCFMDVASSVAAESVFADEFKIPQNKTVKKGFHKNFGVFVNAECSGFFRMDKFR